MAKHLVRVKQTFTFTKNLGALVVQGQVIAAESVKEFHYAAGQEIPFTTKKEATDFCKFHGTEKMEYLGKL